MNNKVYVIIDKDMGYVVGVYGSMSKALKKVFDTSQYGYDGFTLNTSAEIEDAWEIVFPHEVPSCVGHWRIELSELEE